MRGSAREQNQAPERGPPLQRVAGLAAARAVFARRPQDVLHIAHAPEARHELAELLRAAAQRRIAYRELPSDELSKLAGTVHHEGISLQVRARAPLQLPELTRALSNGTGFVLALDGVGNPHNIGALLRSAAYFGALAALIEDREQRGLTPAAVRIAEGGAEHVPVCCIPALCDALDTLREAGVQIVGADAGRGEPLARAAFAVRSVIVLGNERAGLSPMVQRRCDTLVHIPGSGQIESLNVSVAAGILLAHAASRRDG